MVSVTIDKVGYWNGIVQMGLQSVSQFWMHSGDPNLAMWGGGLCLSAAAVGCIVHRNFADVDVEFEGDEDADETSTTDDENSLEAVQAVAETEEGEDETDETVVEGHNTSTPPADDEQEDDERESAEAEDDNDNHETDDVLTATEATSPEITDDTTKSTTEPADTQQRDKSVNETTLTNQVSCQAWLATPDDIFSEITEQYKYNHAVSDNIQDNASKNTEILAKMSSLDTRLSNLEGCKLWDAIQKLEQIVSHLQEFKSRDTLALADLQAENQRMKAKMEWQEKELSVLRSTAYSQTAGSFQEHEIMPTPNTSGTREDAVDGSTASDKSERTVVADVAGTSSQSVEGKEVYTSGGLEKESIAVAEIESRASDTQLAEIPAVSDGPVIQRDKTETVELTVAAANETTQVRFEEQEIKVRTRTEEVEKELCDSSETPEDQHQHPEERHTAPSPSENFEENDSALPFEAPPRRNPNWRRESRRSVEARMRRTAKCAAKLAGVIHGPQSIKPFEFQNPESGRLSVKLPGGEADTTIATTLIKARPVG